MEDISLKGYHGTSSFAMKSIEERGLDPEATKSRTDHWLGKGVYFFLDMLQAQWWAINSSKKSKGSFPVVYSANIVAEGNQVLNLDDNNEQMLFRKFIKENVNAVDTLCREEKIGYPIFDRKKFRGVYFDYYKKMSGIKVIIFTFSKDFVNYVPTDQVSKSDFQFQKELSGILGISFKETQICVSDKSCIMNSELVYNGEEAEVI